MKTIYIIGFSPRLDDNSGAAVGGFDWYETPGEARARVTQHMAEDAALTSDYKIRVTNVSETMSRDEVTEWLDHDGRSLWDTEA